MAIFLRFTMIVFFVSPWLISCSYSLHQVHVSDFVAPSGSNPNIVKASASQEVIFGFVYDTDYVDQAYRRIEKKCQNGVIDGITTRHQTELGFLSWINHLYVRAICRQST